LLGDRRYALTFTHKMTVTGENSSRTLGFVSHCDSNSSDRQGLGTARAPDILIP